jgi:uncharacterized protein (TIGR02266 family)
MTKWVQPSESERNEMARYDEVERLEAKQREENRRHERLSFPAEVTVKSQTNFFMGFSENISEGGLFLATLSPPAVGETICLFIKDLNGNDFEVNGVVRWHRMVPSGLVTGCGVQFVDLSPWAQHAFEEMMSQLRKEPLFFEI